MGETIYLVTGAAGFLASTICRQLAADGKKVRGLVHRKAPSLPEEVEIYKGDICDKESLEPFFTVPEGTETIVLHIASIVALDPAYDQRVVDANVGGTNTIIDMCLAHPECKMMVYCSSIGALPESPKGTKIKEVKKFHPEKLRDCYSQTKAQASQNVLDAVKKRGLRACIVHPSGILGPEDWGMSDITKNLIAILHGELPAGIDGSFNLADVRDLADGTIKAGEKGRVGECYILANEVITFKQFCKTIADECGCKPVKFFMPIWMSYATAWCAELIGKITKKPPIMTTFNVYNLARNNEYDYSKAQKELSYTTRSCRETIIDEANWLKKEGLV